MIYMAAFYRNTSTVLEREFRLKKIAPTGPEDVHARRDRQTEATEVFLEWLNGLLAD
jgi:hypothetical protein